MGNQFMGSARCLLAARLLACGLTVFAPTARAADDKVPRGLLVVDNGSVDEAVSPSRAHRYTESHIIYLNRCVANATFTPSATNDSRANQSTVIDDMYTLPAYAFGDESWGQVVAHTAELLTPFDVNVTDIDPGDQSHFEVVVCGHPNDAGHPSFALGVAPFDCAVIDNAIAFAFPERIGPDPSRIAEIVVQEAAHTWGVDHEIKCDDVMSYAPACAARAFQDEAAPCGEDIERPCWCGGTTQNSYRKVMETFGPGSPTPPLVAIASPANGSEVEPGFEVHVEASDNVAIDRVELFIGEILVGVILKPPYRFTAPADLATGPADVRAVAYDDEGTDSIRAISVNVSLGVGSGSNGAECEQDRDCASGTCRFDGVDHVCVDSCDHATECPSGFDCVAQAEAGVCLPSADDVHVSQGCSSAVGRANPPQLPWGLILAVGLCAWLMRRQ